MRALSYLPWILFYPRDLQKLGPPILHWRLGKKEKAILLGLRRGGFWCLLE